ncbi:diguanylate cyclase [Cohnella sp. CFH 77786]|uniref:GGDEF domain-containing protein n=1 Tax=Cohnella sp. CFH 77786 TaxID=2662265 RepID=UPI001C60D129|nr:GGDEF domain-containing protein [Cohnella sp. CFH 77786]MBW5445816.1 diguanylate cyclase [Cohnella sp. CFH 77786]
MDYNCACLANLKEWNRRVVSAYWIAMLFYMLATGSNLLYTSEDKEVFFRAAILLPSIKIVIVLLLTEIAYRNLKDSLLPYVLIVSGNLFAAIVILSIYEKTLILIVLLFPLFSSVFYFDKKIVQFASIVSLLTCIPVFYLFQHKNPFTEASDFITILALLAAGSVILLKLMKRGLEMIKKIEIMVQKEQELLYRNKEMETMVTTDALTGLKNHRAFHEYMDRLLFSNSSEKKQIQIALIDIDNFKQVNDTYGHHVGDQILSSVAAAIRKGLGEEDFAGRYGGEEFVVIFRENTMKQCCRKLEAIRESIALLKHEGMDGKAVTVSIGLNEFTPDKGKDFLFIGADRALYEAKKNGKNQTRIASDF